MIIAKLSAPRTFELVETPSPDITGQSETALVSVAAAGICGGDMHPFLGHSDGFAYGVVRGHELSGVIKRVNTSGVLKPGDRVAVNPLIPCGECRMCLRGEHYLCERANVIGGSLPGAFCEMLSVPVACLHKLPDDADLTLASLTEPLAFALHCTRGIEDKSCVVLGQGTIGLLCAMLLSRAGCDVITLDLEDSQLELSRRLAHSVTINSRLPDAAAATMEAAGPRGADCVIDTVFSAWSLSFDMDVLNKGGRIIAVGIPRKSVELEALRMIKCEISVSTRFLYDDNDFTQALDLMSSGVIDLSPLVSSVFPLRDIQAAFEYKASTPCQKVVLTNI